MAATRSSAASTMAVNVSARQLQDAGLVGGDRTALRRRRPRSRRARARDHRERHRRRHRRRHRPARGAQGARCRPGHRRLRDGLLVAVLPAPLPRRPAEDRPVVRGRGGGQHARTGPSSPASSTWPTRSGIQRRRRRRGDGRAAGVALGARLRPRPGLQLAAARPARRDRPLARPARRLAGDRPSAAAGRRRVDGPSGRRAGARGRRPRQHEGGAADRSRHRIRLRRGRRHRQRPRGDPPRRSSISRT